MKVIVAFLLFIIFLLPCSTALDVPPLSDIKDGYNENINNIPSFVRTLIGTERINAYIALNNGSTLKLSATSSKGMLETLDFGEIENATMIIRTGENTIINVTSAADPVKQLKAAFAKKEITYEPQGFFKKAKWGFVSLVVRFGMWFGVMRR